MDHSALKTKLVQLDGRSYKAYRAIAGEWRFPTFIFYLDHIQGDPFAAPSRVRVVIPPAVAQFPAQTYANRSRATGVAALLARHFAQEARQLSQRRGTGKSGRIEIEAPGQQVFGQSAVQLHEDGTVEARCTVGLPAQGLDVLDRRRVGDLAEFRRYELAAVLNRLRTVRVV